MDIQIEIEEEVPVPFAFDYADAARNAASTVLSAEAFPYAAEVNLLLTGADEIRVMNRDFREIDRETDVLSFPMQNFGGAETYENPPPDEADFDADTGRLCLGDIVLCVPKVLSQAEEYGHSILREFSFLIVHSMLHLLGYDHIADDERVIMEDRQRHIMELLAISR